MDNITNWNYVPKDWHDILLKDNKYDEKVNLTRIFKAVYDSSEITYDDGVMHFNSKLEPLMKVFELDYTAVQDHIRILLLHLCKVQINDDTYYELLWDRIQNIIETVDGADKWTVEQLSDYLQLSVNLYSSDYDLPEYENFNRDNFVSYDGDPNRVFEYFEYGANPFGMGSFLLPRNLKLFQLADSCYKFFTWEKYCELNFNKPIHISKKMSSFLNIPFDKKIGRTEVTKRLLDYIKDHGLEDPSNRQKLIMDSKLESIIGDTDERLKVLETRRTIRSTTVVTTNVTYFNLQIFINKHFPKTKKDVSFGLPFNIPQWKEIYNEMYHYHYWKDVHCELNRYWHQPPCAKNSRGGYHYRQALKNFTLFIDVHMNSNEKTL